MADSNVQIIPFYAHPHVHTVIYDHTQYDESVASREPRQLPFSVAVVAGADKGIDNTFVCMSDLRTKRAIFGKGNYQKYGQESIQADVLFNGETNVWFCRVLPDNATYANSIILAHYRKGNILDDKAQETGLKRLEVKFSVVNATQPYLSQGATDDLAIQTMAESLKKETADPVTGYMTLPLCYVRSIGRGKYGNNYAMKIARDVDAEKEYTAKMFRFSLIDNETSQVINEFAGSLYQTTRYGMSTLISDVLDQFSTGSCPVKIHSFEKTYDALYELYQEIVAENAAYIENSNTEDEDILADLVFAKNLAFADGAEAIFDPVFGYRLNTRTSEIIPYYRNYTVKDTGEYITPDLVVGNTPGAKRPTNIASWGAAYVGAKVLMVADPLNAGSRWMYEVINITDLGDIIYDEGVETFIDDDQYDGVNLGLKTGFKFIGGSDGDFEEITINGITQTPPPSIMKLLLAREEVKAFHGEKDRKILSPAQVDLDFIFDAGYNMTRESEFAFDNSIQSMYNNSSILTDEDYAALTVIGSDESANFKYVDLNVKAAMYDLNEFRNRNGMTINPERGAGCLLHLDCGIVGLNNVKMNYELIDTINAFDEFTGRSTSIDLGHYEIFESTNGKRVKVTTSYFLAQKLIPHLLREGLNKPFTYNYATLTALQRDAATLNVTGDMIRDSFRPNIDLIDWDVKEKLYTSRINYYLTRDEGRNVQRAVQNTRQLEASALLEENNVRVLNTLKKGLEKACRGYLYNWNEPEARKGYTDAQMAAYRPWIGTMVQSLNIRFDANAWEQERMIMHCYVDVAFRDIVKRVILEININRPDYSGGDA